MKRKRLKKNIEIQQNGRDKENNNDATTFETQTDLTTENKRSNELICKKITEIEKEMILLKETFKRFYKQTKTKIDEMKTKTSDRERRIREN